VCEALLSVAPSLLHRGAVGAGEQIWADVGEIIRGQIPDKDGKTIPADVTMGSYESRDLDHIGVGYLYEGKLVMDKSWGTAITVAPAAAGTRRRS